MSTSTSVTPERRALAERLDRLFEESGRSRAEWARALGVTRGAMWQWADCRTVPRPDVWLKILEDADRLPISEVAVSDLLVALDVPLGALGVRQSGRKETTLLAEIVERASGRLADQLRRIPFTQAIGVVDRAIGTARRAERDAEWEAELTLRFERVLRRVVDTAVDPQDVDVDRARLGAAAWRATYAWAIARPDEAITEGAVTRVVGVAVRGLVMEWGGSLRQPTY